MNEQEVKEQVEQIATLEQRARFYRRNDAYYAANLASATIDQMEKELELAGFMLGDSGHTIIVYRANLLLTAQSTYLIFDTANWQWRQPEESEVA